MSRFSVQYFAVLFLLVFSLLVASSIVLAQDAPEATPAPDVIIINPDETTDTTPFQNFIGILSTTLIEAAAPFITALVFGVLWRIYQFIKTRLSSTQHEFLDYLVTTAVQAAEQAGLTQQITNSGRAKKAAAIQMVTDVLRARGYGDVAKYMPQIQMLIEAAVNRGVQDYNKAVNSPPAPQP